MLTTTTVSLADPSLTVATINKSYPAHLRHALIVDLSLLRKAEFNKHLASFLGHLRGIAAQLHTITSLTLDYCCGLIFDLAPAAITSNLKQLIIIENDACDHFIKLQEETCLTNKLSELKIQSTNGCDFTHQYEKDHFGKALMRCHSLKSLDLTIHDSSDDSPEEHFLTELSTFFPSNLEVLQFRGPPTLANHLSVWHKNLSDPTWLPNLKSMKFILDACYRNGAIEQEKANLAHEQCM